MSNSRSPRGADLPDDALLGAASDAVRMGMRACRRVRDQHGEVVALRKEDRSPVTVADFASQALILHHLTSVLGELLVIAEEDAQFLADHSDTGQLAAVVDAVRPDWPEANADDVIAALAAGRRPPPGAPFWTLDPVDGTKGFLRNEQYAVALAYIDGKQPRLGVVGCPNLAHDPDGDPAGSPAGVLTCAVRGGGAFELREGAAGSRVRLPAATPPPLTAATRICLSVESGHSDSGRLDAVLDGLGQTYRAVRLDSQCKYAVVARGQADGYIRAGRGVSYSEWIWDHAAGAVVAAEAGCVVSDLSGRALDFSLGARLTANNGIICAPPALHAAIVSAARHIS